jgi:hypothetical protein
MGDKYLGGGRGQKFRPGDKQLTNKGALNYCTLPPDVPDGSSWLQPKQRLLLPERVAISMQEAGWIVRGKVVWHKKSAMPSSAKDRFRCAWEHVFRMTKKPSYYFDLDSVRTPFTTITVKRFGFAEKYGREMREGKGKGQRSLKGVVDGLGKWAGPKKLEGKGPIPVMFG